MAKNVYYWDSCVFLSYVSKEAARHTVIDGMLHDCEMGKCTIYTSAISISEVAYGAVEKLKRKLDPETEEKIDSLWTIRSPIRIVEATIDIAKHAKELARLILPDGFSASPFDAMHLATARLWSATEFNTYDNRLKHDKYSKWLGFPIREPVADGYLFDPQEVKK